MLLLKSQHYTPKQWIAFSNTFLLLLVTFMCGLVMYEISILDQRFVRVLDSSTVAIDLHAVNLDSSHKMPSWKNINDDISVYSAFYDISNKENGNNILIIGSASFKDDEVQTEDLRCLIDYGEESDIGIERVDYKVVSGYWTIFLYCKTKEESIPKKVALISYANTNPKQWMQVETIHSGLEASAKMAACVQPKKISVTVEKMAQFVEFYEGMGVDHFYFYDFEASEDLMNFILYLKGSGHSIDVLPWNKEIYFGDVYGPWSEHVQDCLHRAMYKYDDVITVDALDFLVPEEHANLFEMLGSYERSHETASNLKLHYTNVCKDTEFHIFSGTSNENIFFRGRFFQPDSNYILVPGSITGILFQDSFTTNIEGKSLKNLPENYGIVHRYGKFCDSSATLDILMSNFSKIFEKSVLLEDYNKVTSKAITKFAID